MQRAKKRLELRHETLKVLDRPDLRRVIGGCLPADLLAIERDYLSLGIGSAGISCAC